VTVLTQPHEQRGTSDAFDHGLLGRRQNHRRTPHRWAHRLPGPLSDQADTPDAPRDTPNLPIPDRRSRCDRPRSLRSGA
jgi:hypothetical protein